MKLWMRVLTGAVFGMAAGVLVGWLSNRSAWWLLLIVPLAILQGFVVTVIQDQLKRRRIDHEGA